MSAPGSSGEQARAGKRRQNVACDACKLRRVKCDLPAQYEPSTSLSAASCSSCTKKGICCTTVKNQTKAAPRRTGARIEAAKRQHGEVVRYDISDSQSSTLQSSGSTPWSFDSPFDPVQMFSNPDMFQLPMSALDLTGWSDSPSQHTMEYQLELWKLSHTLQDNPSLTQRAVDYELGGKSLSTQLSRILIREYFDSMHYQTPAIDPEEFLARFTLAGEMTEYMGASEATCAMLECWGARYSMHPAVLGMKPDDSIRDITAGTVSRLKWGVAREPICRALIERARGLLDKHSVMRKPSLEGVQAMLLLVSMLSSHSWTEEPDRMALLEIQALQCAIAAHSDALDLRAAIKSEIHSPDHEMQAFMLASSIPTSRLYRTAWVNDAMLAASGRRLPQMREETVMPPFELLTRPSPSMTVAVHDHMASLRQFLRTMMSVSSIARSVAREISAPAAKSGCMNVEKLCIDVRQVWEDLDDLSLSLRHSVQDVAKAAHFVPTFSPLNWLVNVRSCMTHLALVIHGVVIEQRNFQDRLRQQPSGSLYELSGIPAGEPAINPTPIEQLAVESVDRTLGSARDYALFVKSISNTDILAHAGVVLRGLAHVALVLSEIPSREQGYLPTRAGTDWTWSRKLIEVGWCIQGLYQMGWAWSDVSELVSMVESKLAEQAPTEYVASTHLRSAEPVPISHYESEALLAFYPPPQVIPSFTSDYPAVGQAGAAEAQVPSLFDLGESVLSDLVLGAESVQL